MNDTPYLMEYWYQRLIVLKIAHESVTLPVDSRERIHEEMARTALKYLRQEQKSDATFLPGVDLLEGVPK